MKPKAIVLDIDDTCLDFLGHLCSIYYWKTGIAIKRSELTEWQLPEPMYETFREYEDLIYASQRTLPKVVASINEFIEKGYKIILMTARPEDYKRVTEFNLWFNKIKYDKLFFNKNKSLKINRLSEEFDIKIFVDDKTETVNKVKRDTDVPSVYLINTHGTRNDDIEEGVVRINNIHEIKEK